MFEPGSDDDLIVRTVREFAKRDVLPVAAEMKRHGHLPRDAPLTLIGGGTGEIVRLLIARRLLAKHRA